MAEPRRCRRTTSRPRRGAASRPSTVRLDLPDLSLDAAHRPGRVLRRPRRPRHQVPAARGARAAAGRHLARPRLRLRAHRAARWPRRSPGATVWAVDVNERALELRRANAAARRARPTSGWQRPTRCPADVRFAELWSNPPIRVGKAALHDLLDGWLGRLDTDGAARCSSSRSTSGADSLHRWLDGEGLVGRTPRASRAGYRLLRGARPMTAARPTGLKRLHRDWRRRTDGAGGAGPRRRAGAVQRRRDPPHRGRPPRRRPVAGGRHAAPTDAKIGKTALGTQRYLDLDVARHGHRRRSAPRERRLPGGGPRAGRRRRAAATSWRSTATVCLVVGHEDRGLPPRPRSPPATRWPTSPSSDGSARSTWPPRPPSPSTSCAAGSGPPPPDPSRPAACADRNVLLAHGGQRCWCPAVELRPGNKFPRRGARRSVPSLGL